MAVIMSLRKRGGLIVAAIGIAIVSFLAMDSLNSRTGIFNRNKDQNIVGKIEGQKIEYTQFNRMYDQMEEKTKYYSGVWLNGYQLSDQDIFQIRQQTWDNLVEDVVMGNIYSDLGLYVSPQELQQYITGSSPTQEIQSFYRQYLTNNQAAPFDRSAMANFIAQLPQIGPGDQAYPLKQFYLFLEKDIKKNIRRQKYLELLQKNNYVPSWQAKDDFVRRNSTVDFKYVALNFSNLNKQDFKPTDEQLKQYLEDHKSVFETDAIRNIEFVVWDILPTHQDTLTAEKWIDEKYTDFQSTPNDSLFLARYSSENYNGNFLFAPQLRTIMSDSIFSADTGTYIGPWTENGYLRVAKVLDHRIIADSVKVRHILSSIKANGTMDSARMKMDSIMGLYQQGVSFDSLVIKLTDDANTRANKGEIGWIKPDDNLFASFKNACFLDHHKGDVFKVESQAGVHLIQIMDESEKHPAVKVGFLSEKIVPGATTRDSVYNQASQFYTSHKTPELFEQGITEAGLTKRYGDNLKTNDINVPGINVPARTVVRWAYNAKVNDMRLFTENELKSDKYIVALLTKVREKGLPDVEEVRDQITEIVAQDMMLDKLSEQMANGIVGANSLEMIAEKLNLEVKTATRVSLSGQYIEGLGFEPAIAAIAYKLTPNEMTGPYKGNGGVFMIETLSTNTQEEPEDTKALQQQMIAQKRPDYSQGVFKAISSAANVEDLRYKFY